MATHSMENPMDRGALRATVHGVTKSQTQLSNYTHIHTRPSSIPTSSMKPSRTLLPDSGCTCNLTCWLTPPLLCIKFWISSKAGPLLWLYTLSLGGSIHITSLPWSRCCSSFIFISNSILVESIQVLLTMPLNYFNRSTWNPRSFFSQRVLPTMSLTSVTRVIPYFVKI